MAAQPALPTKGNLFISLADRQKPKSIDIARGFADLGFVLYATSGTAVALKAAGIPVKKLFKLNEGRPNALDMIKRRAKAAGLSETICCHTFRATGITAYLENGGTIENAQAIANHESPKTTKLYDRTSDQITLDEVERIVI